MAEQSSSQELIHALRSQGHSYAEIGRRVGRDGSLIRQIANGIKPGRNLQGALAEFNDTGEVTTPPLRRTTSKGTLARIRGRRGAEPVIPTPPPGQRIRTITPSTAQPEQLRKTAPTGQRNTLDHQEHRMPGGRELHRITVPKSNQSANRQAGSGIVAEIVAKAAAAGRRISGTVWAEIRRKDGTKDRIPVQIGGHGGYSAQSAKDAIEGTPGGGFGWLTGQVDKRYPEFEGGYTVVGFDIDVW